MKYYIQLLSAIIISSPVYCFADKPVTNTFERFNMQYSINYCRLGDGDVNGLIVKNTFNWELKSGRITAGLNFGGGKYLYKDHFHLELGGNTYTDFLKQQSMLYANVLYSIRSINSKGIALYMGIGPCLGLYSKTYYQFWYKENDVDPYILLMGDYLGGVTFGYSINLQCYIKIPQKTPFFINAGFDSLLKYQSSIFYMGLGIMLNY